MVVLTSCRDARNRLWRIRKAPTTRHPPQGSAYYFPRSEIIKVLTEVGVEEIFNCACASCQRIARPGGGGIGKQPLDEEELLGDYATLYGLLIYLYNPWLISVFQREGHSLHKGYLNNENLAFLEKCTLFGDGELQSIREEILENQYRFRVRQFSARKGISTIHEKEILPINEELMPLGTGDFGVVYELEVDAEYVHESLVPRRVRLDE